MKISRMCIFKVPKSLALIARTQILGSCVFVSKLNFESRSKKACSDFATSLFTSPTLEKFLTN
jgi:hypothetical protein